MEEGEERPVWRVEVAELTDDGEQLRVVVDGEPITVRAPGHRLTDVVEAWATALAIPAARAGATLELPAPVDPRWLQGAQANIAQAAAWWGGDAELDLRTRTPAPRPSPGPSPRASSPELPWWPRLRRRRRGEPAAPDTSAASDIDRVGRRSADGRALCFTAGVDSFFSLLAGDHRPTHLLFVHGFDLPLDDGPRRAAASRSIRAVAAATGTEPLEVETDLRSHHRFAEVSWEHTHGAALIAMAMLLCREIGTVAIPPSYATSRLIPWGSHPELDERWGLPGVLAVEHGDAVLFRRERLRRVVDSPLVHQHLRVCWAHLQPGTNCGRCEKCVRTMIDLEHLGRRDDVATFPRDRDLPELIDAMAPLPASIQPMWRDLAALRVRPEVVAAIERALDRSDPGQASTPRGSDHSV